MTRREHPDNGWASWRTDPGSINSDVFAAMLGIAAGPRDGDIIYSRNGVRVVNTRREKCLAAGVAEDQVDALLAAVDRTCADLDDVLTALRRVTPGNYKLHELELLCEKARARAELFARLHEVKS